MAKTKTPKKAKELNPKAHQCMDYRLRGYSYRAIGRELGMQPSEVYRYVSLALEEAKSYYVEKASQILQIELNRIERMIVNFQEKCLPPDEILKRVEGEQDEKKADKMLKLRLAEMDMMDRLLDRKARLLGFYRTDDTKVKEALPWSDDEGAINPNAPEGSGQNDG